MQPRQSIIDLFSTFVQFNADRFGGWTIDTRLRRNLQAHSSKQSETLDEPRSAGFWVIYWHRFWHQHIDETLAVGHLSAYLQEPCYWSAYKIAGQQSRSQYRLSDYFQAAIIEVPKILKACDPDREGSLKTYASQAFNNIIRDFLRQRGEIDLCSNWGLLLKVSRKRLIAALQHSGLSSDAIAQWTLAWSCFESVYLPTKSPKLRQLPAPDQATWSEIAALYNRQRHQLQASGSEVDSGVIEKWLTLSANRVRSYLYPSVTSLNAPKFGEDTKEVQDDLPDPHETLLTELIFEEEIQERQTQQSQLAEVLNTAIAKLDAASQELLQLYYQQNLTQQEIAKQLNIQQYNVSRKLSRAREALLLTLMRWSQEVLHIPPASNVGKQMSSLLDEWLTERMAESYKG